jgi:capsular exopolysaccharide synthesis family protein
VAYAWTGKRVLLVDGDLRRASLHRAFGIKNERGLIDLLMATEADWHALVQRTEHETLAILPAGRYHHGVPELVDPARMSQFVKAWREEYDMVLVDSAPVGRVVDTMTLAKVCDGVLMVALYGRTGFSDVRHSLRRLAGAKMLGLCLNAIDVPRHSRGGSYAYGYYGRYRPYYYYYRSYYGYGDKYGPRSEDARESTPAPDGRPDAT